jgi:hypothetical protein
MAFLLARVLAGGQRLGTGLKVAIAYAGLIIIFAHLES